MKGWIELTTMPNNDKTVKGHKMTVLVSEIIGVEKAGENAYIILRNRLVQPVKESYKAIVDMIKKIK